MKLNLPLKLYFPRQRDKDKPYYLNLNVYRSTHFRVLNNAKKIYKKLVWEATLEAGMKPDRLLLTAPYRLVYTLHAASRREIDVANVLSVIDKFTSDALVELGYWPDDNYKFIREVCYRFGSIDPDNPRAELVVEEFREVINDEKQQTLDFG